MALLNYTTNVPAETSAMEIQKMLAKAGAKAIMQQYDDDGQIQAISFQLKVGDALAGFKLPTDWRPVLSVLLKNRGASHDRKPDQDKAVKVAWRITKDWVEAQLAIIETQMVKPEQVFLPYMMAPGGQTVYEAFKADPRFLLGGGAE